MKENTVSTQHLLCRLLLALAIMSSPPHSASHRTRGTSLPLARWFSSQERLSANRHLAFAFPLLTLFLGDIFIGFLRNSVAN